VLYSSPMTNAAHTAGLTNPSTGENRLFDVARWLITLLVVHFIIARARRLAAALHKPYGPDDAFLVHFFGTSDRDQIFARMTRALGRAAALEDDLLARRPIEQGFSNETRSAYAAQIIDICRALGFFRAKPIAPRAKRTHPIVGEDFKPAPATRTRIQRTAITATGPPNVHLSRATREPAPVLDPGGAANSALSEPIRVSPWSFSGRAPASVHLASA